MDAERIAGQPATPGIYNEGPFVLDIRTAGDHFPGIGRYAFQLARALARQPGRGELILLAGTAGSSRFSLAELESEPAIRIIRTSAAPFSAAAQMRLPAVLRQISPAVTHYPYILLPYAAPGPAVLTIHDIIPILFPRFFTLRQRMLYRTALTLALRKADAVICVSEAARSDLLSARRIDPSRLLVIHEGIAETFRPRVGKEVEKVRERYGIPREYLLYVGSNKPHKNLPLLVEAYSHLRGAPVLVIAGAQDPRYDQERRQAEKLAIRELVQFPGPIAEEDLPALYTGARAFVFPSLYEGFGLPPLEAMACGCPVACSDIAVLRETMADAALFFDPADCESMAVAMERVLRDMPLREELQARGVRRALEFTWENTARETMAVYRATAAPAAQRPKAIF